MHDITGSASHVLSDRTLELCLYADLYPAPESCLINSALNRKPISHLPAKPWP